MDIGHEELTYEAFLRQKSLEAAEILAMAEIESVQGALDFATEGA